jgi:hypothetical protein
MTDLRSIAEFREYAAPADAAARARARRAVASTQPTPAPRRRLLVRRAALAAAVTLAASIAVALQPGGGRGSGTGGQPATSNPLLGGLATADAATVRRHITTAIDTADGILYATTRDAFVKSGGAILSETWVDLNDPSAWRTREDRRGWNEPAPGFAVSDIGSVPTGTGAVLQRGLTDGRCTELLLTGPGLQASTTSNSVNPLYAIRDDIQSHRAIVVGTESSGGRRLLHVRWTPSDPAFPKIIDRTDVWVDPATYLPVRSQSVYGDPTSAAGDPNEIQIITSTYTLIPRPSDPRSLLLPAIPAGSSCPQTTKYVAQPTTPKQLPATSSR